MSTREVSVRMRLGSRRRRPRGTRRPRMNAFPFTRWTAGLGLAVFAAAPAVADEIIVPTDHTLSVALTLAVSGDIITILPGTYEQVPGFSFSNKQITVRGSTGNPADVVLSGANLDIVLRISG